MSLALNTADSIKSTIKKSMGKSIEIKEFNRQKKLVRLVHGTIVGSFDNLFVVETAINAYKINKSYSYNDFLTPDLFYEIL